MMKIKVSEAEREVLNWAVCKANGEHQFPYDEYTPTWMANRRYSEDWAKGGPIIEREGIALDPVRSSGVVEAWCAVRVEHPAFSQEYGPTPLIAAMRCYVAAMLGDEVDVPDELTGVNK